MSLKNKIAVYPGSFDPIHCGHIDIIQRISKLYDKVIVLVACSSQKMNLFTPEERKVLIEKTFKSTPNVSVDLFSGLVVDYLHEKNAHILVRGLRAVVDFEYEMSMANMNKKLDPEIETLLVFSSPEYYYLSSRGIKEIAMNRGNLKGMVSEEVEESLKNKFIKSSQSKGKI
ncbi:MAG TPA: pantetheine-phosphate adenylyltransferase [Pseudobdellovibrionaceae bacterium]|nr:pantetheine-phosphate adenylyltransferase [Pseudobdellovibrionaceae bacterium]